MFREYSVVWLNTELLLTTGLQCFIVDCYVSCWLDDSVLLLLMTNVTGTLGLRRGECSGRAVPASSSYGPWVPPPLLSSRALPASDWPVPRGGIKEVPTRFLYHVLKSAEKCWSAPPSSPSPHAEKCFTFPFVRGPCTEKCWSTPTPRVYMLKSVLLFP